MKNKFLKFALIPIFAAAIGLPFLRTEKKFVAEKEPANTKPTPEVFFAPPAPAPQKDSLALDSLATPRLDFIVGDQLAQDLIAVQNTPGLASENLSPQELFSDLESFLKRYPDTLKGKNVFVAVSAADQTSPLVGIVFGYKQANLIKQTSGAANVVLMGISDSRTDLQDPRESNRTLEDMCKQSGIIFAGAITNAQDGLAYPIGVDNYIQIWQQAEKALTAHVQPAKPIPSLKRDSTAQTP